MDGMTKTIHSSIHVAVNMYRASIVSVAWPRHEHTAGIIMGLVHKEATPPTSKPSQCTAIHPKSIPFNSLNFVCMCSVCQEYRWTGEWMWSVECRRIEYAFVVVEFHYWHFTLSVVAELTPAYTITFARMARAWACPFQLTCCRSRRSVQLLLLSMVMAMRCGVHRIARQQKNL